MEREQFTFYRSYYEALKTLPKKDIASVVLAVCAYALDETPPELSGVAMSVFTLIRPTLDSGRKKAANRAGKSKSNQEQNDNKQEQTGNENKQEQNRKEGEKEKEGERKEEREGENECYKETPPPGGGGEKKAPQPPPGEPENPAFGRVMTAYMDRICATPSSASVAELQDYCAALGPEICLRAIDEAIDAGARNWFYVRTILEEKRSRGITTIAAWDADREQFDKRRKRQSGGKQPYDSAGEKHDPEADRKALGQLERLRRKITGEGMA